MTVSTKLVYDQKLDAIQRESVTKGLTLLVGSGFFASLLGQNDEWFLAFAESTDQPELLAQARLIWQTQRLLINDLKNSIVESAGE